jgi:formimidoylglutamate deiminase
VHERTDQLVEEMTRRLRYFRFKGLLQKAGWLTPAYVGVDNAGLIQYLSNVAPQDVATESVTGIALPGFQNAHSHAFQYAMAGSAEIHPKGTSDDFWTWREAMYKCALAVGPDEAEAIAAMLYAELLRNGYTHVAEFHYLHHSQDGTPYANLSEMGERMVAAAMTAGIGITLIPVFYQKGGFGRDAEPRQRRFISRTSDDYLSLLDASRTMLRNYHAASLGFSAHSLRAVTGEDISRTINSVKDVPFHMHIAEQKREVSDCIAYNKARPVQWLLDNLQVNDGFFLVHATHLDDGELQGLAHSGATVVLCPSTEGNLGDGIFRMKEYVAAGGRWCVGTDSHIGINPLEEFRMIDYRQRLLTNKRNTFEGDAAQYMIGEALTRGRLSMGRKSADFFELGQSLDAVVYDSTSSRLEGVDEHSLASSLLYHDSSVILGTLVGGNWLVKDSRHVRKEAITKKYLQAMKVIRQS